jgi:AraC-like DNA-binding protein
MKRLRVSPQAFVGHLLNEKNTLHFELSAMPMDFHPREGWLAEASGIPHHLFYFCKTGAIQAKVGSSVLDLKAGDAIWIRPEILFLLQSDEAMVTSLSRFRLRLENSRFVNFALKNDFVVARNAQLNAAWLEALRQESYLPALSPSRSLRCAVAGLISMTFLQHSASPVPAASERKLSPAQIRILNEWVQKLPAAVHPDTSEMAAQLQLSRDYMNRLCRATFAISAERWLITQRIRSAAQRFNESTLNLSQIAEEYGYTSLYFFSRQFRHVMGCSPREWKRRVNLLTNKFYNVTPKHFT